MSEEEHKPTGFEPLPQQAGEAMKIILRFALRGAILLTVAVAVIGSIVGWVIAEDAGVWGALMGAGLTLVFCGTTIIAMMLTAHSSPTTMSAVVVGTWLLKVILTLVLVLAVRDATFYSKPVFVVTVIVAVLGTLALDMRSVYSGRMPYTSR